MPAPGDTVSHQFTTRHPVTRIRMDADALPTAVLVRNSVDTDVTCTVTNVSVGIYRVVTIIPTTYLAGDELEFRLSASIDSIADSYILNIGEVEVLAPTTGVDAEAQNYLEVLAATRDNYAQILLEMSARPKPTYSVNGQSFSWVEYQSFLRESIKQLNELIAAGQTPYEITSQGFSL